LKLFFGSTNKSLAEKISKEASLPLGELEIFKFPDGETRVRVIDNVVDEDVWVLQSRGRNPDSSYMELFFIVDALKRSGARFVGTIIPYLSYQRQDHVFRSGEAVSLEVIIKTLERVGADKIITLDLHSIKIPELFNIPMTHLSAIPLFAEVIKEKFKNLDRCVLVSPDMGGIRRIKILADELGVSFATIEKNRDLETGEIESAKLDGEIKENAIIVDDMISTGRTIGAAAELLLKNGAKNVYAFATHPVFSSDPPIFFESSSVSEVFVTDSINVPKDKQFAKLNIISVAGLFSKELSKK